MKHYFKFKKTEFKTIFFEKTEFKNLPIEKNSDVNNAVNTILVLNNLEHILEPIECKYNFVTTNITFQLQLINNNTKLEFLDAIKSFETFISLN